MDESKAKQTPEPTIEDQLIDAKQEIEDLKANAAQQTQAYNNLAEEFRFYVKEVNSHLKVSSGSLETLSRRTAGYERFLNPKPVNARPSKK